MTKEKGTFEFTSMMKRYLLKFTFRIIIFVSVLLLHLFSEENLWDLANQPIVYGITSMHVLWAIFMIIMLSHIFPGTFRTMALKKADKENYREKTGYSELEMLRFVQDQNRKAWFVMLVWLIGNGVIGFLYLFHVLDRSDLLMITVFFFLCDYICILIFCPFQTCIMKNKCCVNCRIYDWGHFMMFTPMLFIPNFYSWSLFFTSCVVLIRWEIVYAAHPERFWSGSNQILQCMNCKDKTCQIKRRIRQVNPRKRIEK